MGLGVAILSIMVLGGFQKTVSSRVYGFTGHFQVQKFQMSTAVEEQPCSLNSEFLKKIKGGLTCADENTPKTRHELFFI